jgi:hypothetical protein
VLFSPGVPAINADGMLAGAVGALAFADGLTAPHPIGVAAVEAAARADAILAGIRRRNRASEWMFFHAPDWLRTLTVRSMVGPVLHSYLDDFATVGSTSS